MTDSTDMSSTRRSRQRLIVLVGGMVTTLLLGAAVGMLVTLSRIERSSPPGPDSVDVGFAQEMQVHHLQAVTMAGIERDNTADSMLRQLAFDIESTQLGQVGQLAGWLISWTQPELPPPGQPYMRWMSASGHGHGATSADGGVRIMPGMATSAELAKLRSLKGKEQDVYFLQLMLRHHQGGLEMAQYASEHASQSYVRNLADKIVKGQGGEADYMRGKLSELGAVPLPFP